MLKIDDLTFSFVKSNCDTPAIRVNSVILISDKGFFSINLDKACAIHSFIKILFYDFPYS